MHGPQSIRPIEDVTAESEPADGASHIARDCAGLNFFEIDRGLRDLLPLYLADGRLPAAGAAFPSARSPRRRPARRAGADRRQESAGASCARPLRPRRGLDRLSPRLSRDGEHRLRRLSVSRDEPSRRRAWDEPAAACRRQICLAVPFRAGRVRADVSDQRYRHFDSSHSQVRKRGTQGLSAAKNAFGRACDAVEGHAVHDRTRRRLRRRRDRDGCAAAGRCVAAHRRQMVLFACRCRRGAAAGAPRGSAVRYQRTCAVRLAAAAEGRPAQFLPDRASQGQARHPLDGVGRNSPGRRARLSRRRAGQRLQADDGAGQFIETLAWRPRRGDDAALRERGDDIGADPHQPSARRSSTIRCCAASF